MEGKELLHTISGALHILAAVTWIGSMIYSEFAVKPALKPLPDMKAHAVNGMAMKNFSTLTWTSLIILILTGSYATLDKKKELTPLLEEPSGIVLTIKLILVAIMIGILLIQVFSIGPKMSSLINPSTPQNQENQMQMTRVSNSATNLSKIHLYAGVLIVILAVILSALLEKS
ncbi:DUF4149 domain-containing protein [Sporomusa sp.]|uniref:DUF4149 domain-containing protein n=1 Tax=Sporomusa sp. TaxID=2078658 RepID=UPI002CEAEAED|nr:DUF4149 domain-containing protein [Sporomusa sp.]HWR43479.1 DUF4149 domain-containing protein [Sporomusa sp.]